MADPSDLCSACAEKDELLFKAIDTYERLGKKCQKAEASVKQLEAEKERLSTIAVRTIEAEAAAHGAESRCERLEADCAALREALDQTIRAAHLLHESAVGCAVNHYGEDFTLHGLPGWLSDTEVTIIKARTVLQDNPGAARLAVVEATQPLFSHMRELVAGWHSSDVYERHPRELRITLTRTAGEVYAIVDALAALDGQKEPD